MCGICGAMSMWLANDDIDGFNQLMALSVVRGWEGSGVVAVPQKRSKPPRVSKSLRTGAQLILSDEYTKMTEPKLAVLLGHTRAITTGKFILDDTHPFREDHIIGVHNGTMEHIIGNKIPAKTSDSKILINTIARIGIEETVRKSKGAYVIVWIDTKLDTLNFVRNTERNLYFGWANKYPGTVFWASEARILDLMLYRKYGDGYTVVFMPSNQHMVFDLHPTSPIIKPLARIPLKSDVTPGTAVIFSPPSVPSTGSAYGQDLFETFKDHWVPFSSLQDFLKLGCVMCGAESDMSDYLNKEVHWSHDELFVCHPCYTGNVQGCKHDLDAGRRIV